MPTENAVAPPAAVPIVSAFAKSPECVNSAKKPPTMESPAPVEFISVPFAAGAKYTSPVSVYKSAPSPAMETSTFFAPRFFSSSASAVTCSSVSAGARNISESSSRFGFTRNG